MSDSPNVTGVIGGRALSVSKVLVHVLILTSVIMGIAWIFGDDTPIGTTDCTAGVAELGGDGYGGQGNAGNGPDVPDLPDDVTSSQAAGEMLCTTTRGLGGLGQLDTVTGVWHYFNWHPLLMTFGFILCYMEGAIVFRVMPAKWLRVRKWIHGIVMTIATGCGIAGTICVFKWKNYKNPTIYKFQMPNMYSVHSWIGMATVVLFTLQFLVGLWFFAISRNGAMRAKMIAGHRMVGAVLGGFTAAAIITGIMDQQATTVALAIQNKDAPYDQQGSLSMKLSNWWAVVTAVAGVLVYHTIYDQSARIRHLLLARRQQQIPAVLPPGIRPGSLQQPLMQGALRSGGDIDSSSRGGLMMAHEISKADVAKHSEATDCWIMCALLAMASVVPGEAMLWWCACLTRGVCVR
jgi:hypothetical protein